MTLSTIDRRHFLRLGAGFSTLALAGCAFGTFGPQSDEFQWALQTGASGLSPAELAKVRAAVQKHIDNNLQTGAVTAFAQNDKLLWYEAQGIRNIETGEAMRKDDIFRMMSSTKVVVAVAVLMMMDAGKLSIDDKVSRFVPGFKNPKVAIAPEGWDQLLLNPDKHEELAKDVKVIPAEREITIKDLLTHTSGLSSALGLTPGPATHLNKADLNPEMALADRVESLGDFVLDFQPGSRWSYSPLDGFDVLLHIVELASGQKADEFLQQRLFEPLNMIDTHFNVPAHKQDRLLTLYERKDDMWVEATPMFGNVETKYISGAGGLMSTVHDFMQFELMLLNRGSLNGQRILKPETVDLMASNHVGSMFSEWIPPVTKGNGFGLGVRVVLDPEVANDGRGKGAFGWGGAYGTESWVDPSRNVAAVYFVQQPVPFAPHDFERAIASVVA